MKGPDLDTLCRKTVANKRREKILKSGKKKRQITNKFNSLLLVQQLVI